MSRSQRKTTIMVDVAYNTLLRIPGKSYITQKTASQKHGLQDLRELIGK